MRIDPNGKIEMRDASCGNDEGAPTRRYMWKWLKAMLPALPSNQGRASAQSALKRGIRLGRKINGASLRDSDILLVRPLEGERMA